MAMSKFPKDGGKGFEVLCEKIRQALPGVVGAPSKYIYL